MPTTSAWLGQNDTGGAYIAPSLLYSGTLKQLGWLGAKDIAGAWIPAASLLYSGTLKQLGWLGQLDTAGAWIPTSLIYWQDTGNSPFVPPVPPSPTGLVQVLAGGYLGMTWMKNVLILPKEYWDTALASPYTGQLFPTSPGALPPQLFPY
jgi:hypothetical protein